jgi:hypothetical protein
MANLDLGFMTVELYMPGIYVECTVPGETDKTWYIYRNDIMWEESELPVQMLQLTATDEEGDIPVDSRRVTVNSDMLDIKVL